MKAALNNLRTGSVQFRSCEFLGSVGHYGQRAGRPSARDLSLAAALPAVLSPAAPQGDRMFHFSVIRASRLKGGVVEGPGFCDVSNRSPTADRVSQCVECDRGLLRAPARCSIVLEGQS